MNFIDFKLAIQRQFNYMKDFRLFTTTVDKDKLWEVYLSSFPEGTNPKYKERTEYDCNCCKQFIRNIGNLVTIVNGKLISIWDIKIDSDFQIITDKLSTFVKSFPIDTVYLSTEKVVGTDKNFQNIGDEIKTWNHFYIQLPSQLTVNLNNIGSLFGESKTNKEVFLRSLKDITNDSIDTVLDLISQNSIYRGADHLYAVSEFKKIKTLFDELKTPREQELFCWENLFKTNISVVKIKNTVIGSLLLDLSEGKDIEDSVKSFESKVAPTNYKRPTALVTQSMIDMAKKTVEELGYTSSLERRFASLNDISINNILFADRSTVNKIIDGDVFDIKTNIKGSKKSFDKVEEVTIDNFIGNILPKISSMEVMIENKHTKNLVSLIAPKDMTSKNMFKWDNGFSWSYIGEVTDSIKEKVKNAGGNVTGEFRVSLSWFNYDDLDIHLKEPSGFEIYYANRQSPSKGILDVDMNAGVRHSRTPVENIVYDNKRLMKEGIYHIFVHNFNKRENINNGCIVELEIDGTIYNFEYNKSVKNGERVTVAKISYSKQDGFKILESLPSNQISKTVWNIPTQSFHKVDVFMLSPNYWDDKGVGNKHYFFMLNGCKNDGRARGFYNEFFTPELDKHRKVMEIVGSKSIVESTDNQLSGVGFSSTQKDSILCKVKGSFTRTLKINF